MSDIDDIFGQEEEGFEELVEKNLGIGFDNDLDDDMDEDLSDLEEIDESKFVENTAAMKTEERLQSVMNMTTSALNAASNSDARDEKRIKTKIQHLCSALGGMDPTDPETYIVGIEALGCLKDIKELFKRIDEERGLWTVASACHDSGLFVNDLVPILIQYGSTDTANADPEIMKILLATIELMVRMMTPLALDDDNNENRRELQAKLRRAQIEYKNALLHYKNGKVFKYLIALMIPILQIDLKNVARRDNVILNLCLTLFGNVLRVKPSDAITSQRNRNNVIHVFDALPAGIKEEDISLEVVLAVYKKYQVLSVVQTIASNLTKEFETEVLGTACLDFYYYAFSNVDPRELNDEVTSMKLSDSLSKELHLSDFQDEQRQELTSINNKLDVLMQQEDGKKKNFYSKSSTRHANFGSLISIQNKKSNRVVSGQKNLLNDDVFQMLDSNLSKTASGSVINHRRSRGNISETYLKLNHKTRQLLARFVEDFIENGFGVLCKEIYNKLLSDKTVTDFTFHCHYYFVANWILKFERSYQSVHSRNLKTIERYKFLFYWFSKKVIQSLMENIIGISTDTEKKRTEHEIIMKMVSVLKEIMLAAISIHSYDHFDTSKMLNDDKILLASLVARGEGTLRLIFSVNSEIIRLFNLPRDSHKKSQPYAMEMIDFTAVALKVIKYIQHLKVPIMLTSRSIDDYDDEGALDSDNEVRLNPKNVNRFKALDKNQCEKFKEVLFNDQTVNTHIWLFYQFKEIDESKLQFVLNYFSKLLQNWELNIFKLIRLDFMLIMYQLKDASISPTMKSEFGEILNFFMHKLGKMHQNTATILLEPTSLTEMNDVEIKQYYLTGDAFSTYDLTAKETAFAARGGNEDIKFTDPTINDAQKISLIVSYLNFHDRMPIVEEFVKFLTQWYHELANSMQDDITVVGKLNNYRLEGKCYKEYKTGPYFRLLCKIGNIVNGVLIKRDIEELKQFTQHIEVSMNTTLQEFELENKFIDPNIVHQQMKKMGLKRKNRNSKDDEDEEDYDDIDGYNDYEDNNYGYGDEGIDDGDSDEDLAGSEDDQDQLDLLEAQLSSMDNRVKGKAMKKGVDGELEEMGSLKKNRNGKKRSKKDKSRSTSKKKLHKKRKIVEDDGNILSETEILRRAKLSKEYIADSDNEAGNDEEFFAREMKLQELLKKRHGKISKDQYDSLMNGTLNIDDVSDLDDNVIDEDALRVQVAHAKPDTLSLMELLKSSKDKDNDSNNENSDNSSDGYENDDENNEGNDDNQSDSVSNSSEDDIYNEGENTNSQKEIKSVSHSSSGNGKNRSVESESESESDDSLSIGISDFEEEPNASNKNDLLGNSPPNSPSGSTSASSEQNGDTADLDSNNEDPITPIVEDNIEKSNSTEKINPVVEKEEEKEEKEEKTEAEEADMFADLRAMRDLMKE